METLKSRGYIVTFYTKAGFMRNCKFNNDFNNLIYSGKVFDITEELAEKIVDKCFDGGQYFKHYSKQDRAMLKAVESFQTLSNLSYCIITKE